MIHPPTAIVRLYSLSLPTEHSDNLAMLYHCRGRGGDKDPKKEFVEYKAREFVVQKYYSMSNQRVGVAVASENLQVAEDNSGVCQHEGFGVERGVNATKLTLKERATKRRVYGRSDGSIGCVFVS